jgi:hypothetical protein
LQSGAYPQVSSLLLRVFDRITFGSQLRQPSVSGSNRAIGTTAKLLLFLFSALSTAAICLGYHYAAIHLFILYRKRGFKEGMFPVAERVCRQIVTLPLFPSMTESDVDRVVATTKAILG